MLVTPIPAFPQGGWSKSSRQSGTRKGGGNFKNQALLWF